MVDTVLHTGHMDTQFLTILALRSVRPEAVLPDRALCLPTFSHFLIVNKTNLSLLSISLSLSRGRRPESDASDDDSDVLSPDLE